MLLACGNVWAQTDEEQSESSVEEEQEPSWKLAPDTFYMADGTKVVRSVSISKFGHSPHTATMYAAIFPGLGQIYNKKYWKLPILYGGIAALCYGVHFNGKYYKLYRRAYRDFVIGDPNNKAYAEVLKKSNLTVEDVETKYSSWFTKTLSNKKDTYRRYRDLCYFGLIGVYGLQILDAAVDAHFFNFDVSDDLSVQWSPTVSPSGESSQMGASVVISF